MINFTLTRRHLLLLNTAAGVSSNFIKVLIQLMLLPIMTRLLGPEEFGLYALALPTISFFSVLADGGLGMSLARERDSSELVWSTAFWFLIFSCSVIAVIVSTIGLVLGYTTGQPRLPGIMAFLSLNFPLMALSILPAARLMGRGNLIFQSFADIVSVITGAVAAVFAAFHGAGAWSLAIQFITSSLIRVSMLNLVAFRKPEMRFEFNKILPHVSVGGSIIGSRLSEFTGRLLENMLYGMAFGTAGLGAYALANQISRFLCETVSNPLWGSLYAHVIHEDINISSAIYVRITRLVALMLFPSSALIVVSAPHLFPIVFGDKWSHAILIMQIILPFYALSTVANMAGVILLAKNKSGYLLLTQVLLNAGRLLAVAVAPWIGVNGVAWGIGIAYLLFSLSIFSLMHSLFNINQKLLFRSIFIFMIGGLLSSIVYTYLVTYREFDLAWVIVSISVACASFAAFLLLFDRNQIIRDINSIRRVISSRL